MHFTFFVGFKMHDKFVGSRTGKATGKSKMVSLIFLYKKIYIYLFKSRVTAKFLYRKMFGRRLKYFLIAKCLLVLEGSHGRRAKTVSDDAANKRINKVTNQTMYIFFWFCFLFS